MLKLSEPHFIWKNAGNAYIIRVIVGAQWQLLSVTNGEIT